MENVVIVAVSILGVVFLASFSALLFICRQKYCKKQESLINDDTSSVNQNVLSFDENSDDPDGKLVLGSVLGCNDGRIRQLLETEEWANDIHGLIPHCIAILKMCREITEKLVAVTMDTSQQNVHPSHISEIVSVAKCITPRVDDVMRAIAPPLNPKLLEARSAALIYSVQHLALLVRNAWQSHTSLDWIDAAMDSMSQHMKILRDPSSQQKNVNLEERAAEELCDEISDDPMNLQCSQL